MPDPRSNVVNGHPDPAHEMKILVQPPAQVRPGAIFDPPIVVCLDRKPNHSAPNGRLMAVFAVKDDFGHETIGPPTNDLLHGGNTGSIKELNADGIPESRDGKFILFENIALLKDGKYTLNIALMEVTERGMDSLQAILTREINVASGAVSSPPGECLLGTVSSQIVTRSRSSRGRDLGYTA